jgi:hypothetical protein
LGFFEPELFTPIIFDLCRQFRSADLSSYAAYKNFLEIGTDDRKSTNSFFLFQQLPSVSQID